MKMTEEEFRGLSFRGFWDKVNEQYEKEKEAAWNFATMTFLICGALGAKFDCDGPEGIVGHFVRPFPIMPDSPEDNALYRIDLRRKVKGFDRVL